MGEDGRVNEIAQEVRNRLKQVQAMESQSHGKGYFKLAYGWGCQAVALRYVSKIIGVD